MHPQNLGGNFKMEKKIKSFSTIYRNTQHGAVHTVNLGMEEPDSGLCTDTIAKYKTLCRSPPLCFQVSYYEIVQGQISSLGSS